MSQVILINKGGHTYQMNVVHVLPNSIQNVRYGYGVIGLSTTVVKKSADNRPRIRGRFTKRLDVEECGIEGDGECESGGSLV